MSPRVFLILVFLLFSPALAFSEEGVGPEAGLWAEGRVAFGMDRILGPTLRAEGIVDYLPWDFLVLRAGLSVEVNEDGPFRLDAYFAEGTLGYSWAWFRAEIGSAFLLTYMPFTGTASFTMKPLLGLKTPFLEGSAGINYRSYPSGLWDAEFLFRVALRLPLDEERLVFQLSLADYGDFAEGSLSTIRAGLEALFRYGPVEYFAAIDLYTAGTVAFSGTYSRLLIGGGARWRLL